MTKSFHVHCTKHVVRTHIPRVPAPGVDDAQALFMVLGSCDVEVVAVTTVHSNVDAAQVARNVLRILKVAGRTEVRHQGQTIIHDDTRIISNSYIPQPNI